MIDEQGVNTQPVVIEDDVWVGANSVILPGVTLGKHCVVAAGSVVSHSVPSYSICAGCPAKVIKTYDFETKEWKRWKKQYPVIINSENSYAIYLIKVIVTPTETLYLCSIRIELISHNFIT